MRKSFVCLLCILLLLTTDAYGMYAEETIPIGDASPVLKVAIRPEEDETSPCEYQAVYPQGQQVQIAEFEPDETTAVYTAPMGAFSSRIENNTIINTLHGTILFDKSGRTFAADEITAAMMRTVADTIDHDISHFQAVTDGNRYFAYVELNVNWHCPGILYEYQPETGMLAEMCRWNCIDLIDISICQPESQGAVIRGIVLVP